MTGSRRRQLVAGNWKMNGSRRTAAELASAVAKGVSPSSACDVLVCPPYPYLLTVLDALGSSPVALGAQDVYFEAPGAFTGEVAVPMLLDCGCRYVILGHSERRHVLGESDEVVGRKVQAAVRGGLNVVLCVGELLSEREANQTESVLERQISKGLTPLEGEDALLDRVTVAYEPVWAIGTGRTATPEQAEQAHAHLRKWLATRYNPRRAENTRILYGGSVKGDNAAELLSQPDVDGALVGGASLKADSFLAIVSAARQ